MLDDGTTTQDLLDDLFSAHEWVRARTARFSSIGSSYAWAFARGDDGVEG